MKNKKSDDIYAKKLSHIDDFVFDSKVADVFDDMIERSVPGYSAVVNMTGCLAQQHVSEGSVCYDLGCSLGTSTLAMARNIKHNNCRIVAVDNSSAMMDKCKTRIGQADINVDVDFVCDDIKNIAVKKASMVVLNYTLQFIDPQQREGLLKHIYGGMIPGGILLISEKIVFEESEEQAFQENMHHTFKKLNGYSDLEIAQKRTALENILRSDTLAEHKLRLKKAGFKSTHVWFQCFNFVSMSAVK